MHANMHLKMPKYALKTPKYALKTPKYALKQHLFIKIHGFTVKLTE